MGRVSPSEAPAADVVPQPDDITRLLREQAPRLADLPVRAIPASGSSNWVFRLGERWAVRLPRTDAHVSDLLNEVRWLPRLAAGLPAPVPRVVAVGEPSEVCPRPWIVVSWLSGDRPARLDAPAQSRFARTLGEFLCALHEVDTGGVPAGAAHGGYRCGEPVTDTIDEWADRAATALADLFDEAAVREAWRRLRDGAIAWVVGWSLTLFDSGEVVGANIGAGLVAFAAVAVVSLVWSCLDARHGWGVGRVVLTWLVVGLALGLVGAFQAQGSVGPFDPHVLRSDLVGLSVFGVGLTTVPALVGAVVGRSFRRP